MLWSVFLRDHTKFCSMDCSDGPDVVCVALDSPTEQRDGCFDISYQMPQQRAHHLGPGTPSEVDQWPDLLAGDDPHAGDHEFARERASAMLHRMEGGSEDQKTSQRWCRIECIFAHRCSGQAS